MAHSPFSLSTVEALSGLRILISRIGKNVVGDVFVTYDTSLHRAPFMRKAAIAISFSTFLVLAIFLQLPTVYAQTGDFILRTTFKGLGLPQGSTYNMDEVNVTSINGFSGNVSLTAAVSPIISNGPRVSLYSSRISVTPSGSSYTAITVSTVSLTPIGNYTVTITGVNDTISHTTSFWLYVSVPYQPPDFTITPYSSTVTSILTPHIVQNISDNLTLTSLNGFAGTISLSFRSDPGPGVFLTPSSVTLNGGGTATAMITIQPFLAGNYSVTVTGTSSLYPSRSTTVTFDILPPSSDVAVLAYRLSYNAKPFLGETLLLTNNFTNQGAALITVTGLTFNLGFGSFVPSSGLPMNLTSGQSKALYMTIQIPSSTQLGNQSLLVTLEWKYYAPGQGLWRQGPTRYVSGSLSVSQNPLLGPIRQIVQLLGLVETFGPWLIVAWAVVAGSASTIMILHERKRQTRHRPTQPP